MAVCLLNGFLPLFPPSPLFLDTSGIWWQDPPSLAAVEASWDVTEMAALRKAADDSSELSYLERDRAEELAVPDPVSAWLSVESIFPVSLRKWETFYTSLQVLPKIKSKNNLGALMLKSLSWEAGN